MTNNLIVKSNQVVEAGYELTTNEQRLILLGISKIPKEQDINPYFGLKLQLKSSQRLTTYTPRRLIEN